MWCSVSSIFQKLDLSTLKKPVVVSQMQMPTPSSFQFSIDGLVSQTRSSCSNPTHSACNAFCSNDMFPADTIHSSSLMHNKTVMRQCQQCAICAACGTFKSDTNNNISTNTLSQTLSICSQPISNCVPDRTSTKLMTNNNYRSWAPIGPNGWAIEH